MITDGEVLAACVRGPARLRVRATLPLSQHPRWLCRAPNGRHGDSHGPLNPNLNFKLVAYPFFYVSFSSAYNLVVNAKVPRLLY